MTQNATVNAQSQRLEFKRPGYTLELVFAPDASTCAARYVPSGGATLCRTEVEEFLALAGVNTGIRAEGIGELLGAAGREVPASGVVLAEGVFMTPGEDGRICLSCQERDATAPGAEGKDPVDLRQVQEFLNVEEGELVATILPAGEGTAGLSVFGAEIPPVPGKPLLVKTGKNVRICEDGGIYATANGRVFCQGSEISVEDVYLVSGDVDFKVGNIDYAGFLEVTGDILDGFKVSAAKGIKVHGNIGACTVASDGDISFCGMNGQGHGSVRCGGVLRANFIYDTKLEVSGELVVESEIRLCGIKCLGAVRVNRGGIAGGECVALSGVEAATLGSVTSLPTRIVVGVSYRDLEEITRCFEELKELTDRQKQEGTRAERDLLLKERARITGLIREIRSRRHEAANAKVNVRKVLYGGVTVSLDMLAEEFREERPGPFSMVENKLEGGVRLLGLTELSISAAWIEEEFRRQAENARTR